MIIVGINKSNHDAAVALMIDNEIIFHLEAERISNVKHDQFPFEAIRKIKDYVDYVDIVALSGFYNTTVYDTGKSHDAYAAHIHGLGRSFYEHGIKMYDFSLYHHQTHAATSFYNSGFQHALCIVKDGRGSQVVVNDEIVAGEISSVIYMEYPYKIQLVAQHLSTDNRIPTKEYFLNDNIKVTNSVSEGYAFEQVSNALGFGPWGAGKVMGLSSYGENDDDLPNIYDQNGLINNKIFPVDGELQFKNLNEFKRAANFSFKLQQEIQSRVAEEIIFYINKTGVKNVCLSGGYFLNCVSNYHLLSVLPDDVNIYVEPISTDAGTALGAAKLAYYMESQSKEIKPQKSIYYGPKPKYGNIDEKQFKVIKASANDVAKLISEKNIIAIFQGSSESGPRALGNRSILYDPRDPKGKDAVNVVKRRESFRPFAGTVMLEHANDWFNMRGLSESPFMMFAVDVLEQARDKIPAITHVDGSCRIQTLNVEQNKNYYNLIKSFYELTGIPILLNTSFNLAGDSIVETVDDALNTLKKSSINYLYLPELEVIVAKNDCK